MKITLDESWEKVLDLLRGYEIMEATLERNGDALVLEEMNESHVVLVRTEFKGFVTGEVETDRFGINVGKLFWILKKYSTPCRAEIRSEDSEVTISPLNDEYDDEITLSMKEPDQEKSVDMDMEHGVEAGDIELGFPLRSAMKIHGVEGFQTTITAEDGKMLLDYWTEDSVDGNRSILGQAEGDDASATYHPKLLKPLRGRWDLQLGADQPLKAEKVIDGDGESRKANVTVIVAPKVKNVD